MAPSQEEYELAEALHSVAIHLLRRARVDDTSFGLSAARLSALSVLVFGGPQRLTRLAELEQVRPPTMSKMVRSMAQDGLVEVRIPRTDRRERKIHATGKGKRLLERARQARVANLTSALGGTSSADRQALHHAVTVLQRQLRG